MKILAAAATATATLLVAFTPAHAAVALASTPLTPASAAPPTAAMDQPVSEASSFVVVDVTNGVVLAEREPFAPQPPASTLKVLTALTAEKAHGPGDLVLVSEEASRTEGSRVGLYGGQYYQFEDLLEGLLLVSGNDVAAALAQDQPDLVAQMQREASSLGMTGTHVVNPHGLYDPTQVTTSYDLAIAMRAALEDPELSAVLHRSSALFTRHDGTVAELFTHGGFTGVYPGALAAKTGYTVDSGSSFVGAAERDGRVLVVAMLRTRPGVGAQAASLLDWGFAHPQARTRDFTTGVAGPALRAAVFSAGPQASTSELTPENPRSAPARDVSRVMPVVPVVLAAIAFLGAPLLALVLRRRR